jgi:hypothetical protein
MLLPGSGWSLDTLGDWLPIARQWLAAKALLGGWLVYEIGKRAAKKAADRALSAAVDQAFRKLSARVGAWRRRRIQPPPSSGPTSRTHKPPKKNNGQLDLPY